MPPLGHAVRLVDGEQGDRAPVEQPQRRFGAQPFRGQVEQVKLAGAERGLDQAALARVLRRVQEPGPHPERPQRVHLVLHQRDERGDDHAGALAQQRGHLVAQGLAATGRHQHQRVTAAGDVVDDLLLVAAERVVAEDTAQDLQCLAHVIAGFGRPPGHSTEGRVPPG